eukprot:CAMPEP_0205922934 /NCGR_PEP_ID=MMETSP1325-20131115/15300_1 /ASSEMBLY_ACC=CAM_ASM_000708 /TAXON_ID=236786 /ORGANISM="Florenciella sp., Strain RCC1007" /LENGTH=55 /DNA_ID=CAMNT_0053291041 /DNA_START=87 /DNA_END=251 /DNA_ORIENTATION=-
MKTTILALAALSGANATLFSNETHHQKTMWDSFKAEYRKQYSTMAEENERFGIFI